MADDDNSAALQDLVRGRLSEAEAARLTGAMDADPLLKAEHRLVAALNDADPAPHPFQPELGWARLSRAIDRDAPRQPWQRNVKIWQAAAGLAVAIFAWQLMVSPYLVGSAEGPARYVTATGSSGATDPATTLRIAFVPEATEEAVRLLLREVGADVVGGPTALGFYTVAFANEDAREAALERFGAATSVVQFADPS